MIDDLGVKLFELPDRKSPEFKNAKILTAADSPYDVLKTDSVLLCNTISGEVIINFPEIFPVTETSRGSRGRQLTVARNSFLNYAEIIPNAANLLRGTAIPLVLANKGDCVTFIANASGNWDVLHRSTAVLGTIRGVAGATQDLSLDLTKLAAFTIDSGNIAKAYGDSDDDSITINNNELVGVGGDLYNVTARVDVSSYANNQEICIIVYVGGVATPLRDVRVTHQSFDTILAITGLVQVPNEGDKIELYIAGSTSATATFEFVGMAATRFSK